MRRIHPLWFLTHFALASDWLALLAMSVTPFESHNTTACQQV